MGSVLGEGYDPMFEKYGDHRAIWPSLPAMGMMLCLAVVGTFGNLNVAYATYKNALVLFLGFLDLFRHLRNSCNYLLSIACISDSLHQAAHFTTSFIMFSRLNFISLRLCVFLQTPSLIGLNIGVVMTLLIGVDRLIAVMLPMKHRQMNLGVYLGIMFSIAFAFSTLILFRSYRYMLKHPTAPTVCTVPDALPGDAGNLWFLSCIVINLTTCLCYLIVWIGLKSKAQKDATKRIFKSLTVIMLFLLFGWTLNAVVRTVLVSVDAQRDTLFHFGMYSGTCVNVACASNALILYVFSQDYRRALRKQFNAILRQTGQKELWFGEDTKVTPSDFSHSRHFTSQIH